MTPLRFELLRVEGGARLGRVYTRHGDVETPAFMPVGTQGTVKGLLPEQLLGIGAQILLANTYHLALRPGAEVVAGLGGLHSMMGWQGPILTDSGGFQIFSLADRVEISDRAAKFRSHIDGAAIELGPEQAVAIQEQLGADIIMCLDHCPCYGTSRLELSDAVRRTTLWAERCRRAQRRSDQALFGIVQGGIDQGLRSRSAAELRELDLAGYAIGGLSVGESHGEMLAVLDHTAGVLPEDRPRYLMGVGTPRDIIEAVARGVDLFDCVLPTRNGRNATAFTHHGQVRLRNAEHRTSTEPIEAGCPCTSCKQFSRGYLRHLFAAGEMLGPILVSLHNVCFFLRFMAEIRQALAESRFGAHRSDALARLAT